MRRLPPWHTNTGKRVTKAPKVLVRDSGLLHALLDLDTLDAVLGHPAAGPSYESFAIENLIAAAGQRYRPHHYRTARGEEVDLVLARGGEPAIAVEVKRSSAPSLGDASRRAFDDLDAAERYLVHPDVDGTPYDSRGVQVIGLHRLVTELRERAD